MTRRFLTLAALVTLAGCTLDRQGAPSLAGPSELGLSLAITATPDIITQDGSSQALIEVVARDAHSQPVRGLSLRLETAVGGVVADVGKLSARTVSTNNDGRASAVYQSPPAPPPTTGQDTVINIIVTPVGSNYQNTEARAISLRLARPGDLNPPNGAPKPSFIFSPSTPKDHEDVFFDASGSTDDGVIVNYSWNFGDGGTGSGVRATHAYGVAGSFNVTLTVTDDRGGSASSASQAVAVSANTLPSASFVTSPSSVKAGSPVLFNAALSTAAPGREIVGYEWDFGDGTPHGGGQTPSHTYSKAGSYTVVLTVTDSAGQHSSMQGVVSIIP